MEGTRFKPVCKSLKCLLAAGKSAYNSTGVVKDVLPAVRQCPDCQSVLFVRRKEKNPTTSQRRKCSSQPSKIDRFY